MKQDFVREVIAVVRRHSELSGVAAEKIERELRLRYAGEKVSVTRQAPIDADFINSQIRERKSVRLIAVENGLSRSTIYRILERESLKKRNR